MQPGKQSRDPRPPLRTWRYYRNALLTVSAVLLYIALGILSGPDPVDIVWLLPLGLAVWQTYYTFATVHPSRLWSVFIAMRPAGMNLPVEEIAFQARDGLWLGGWFLPGRERAAVILAHGLNGSCSTLLYHIEFLFKAGFSVLAIDLRAHGRSHGDTCTYGMLEANDVLGALDYLRTRPEVDPGRIGALGISLGAQSALRAALQDPGLRALVLEGLGPVTLKDHGRPRSLLARLLWPFSWLLYHIGDFMTGVYDPEPARRALARVARPFLLIAAGRGTEQKFGRLLIADAHEPKELWELPAARHAAAFFHDPLAYREKVVLFFRRELD